MVVHTLPVALHVCIFEWVDAQTLFAGVPLACSSFRRVCLESDEHLWRRRCVALWEGKVESSYLRFATDAMLGWDRKYVASLMDSTRAELTEEELCEFVWAFRFKEAAGDWCQAMDPFWVESDMGFEPIGASTMLRKFCADRTMECVGPSDVLHQYAIESGMNIRWKFNKSRKISGVRRSGRFLQLNSWPSAGIFRIDETWGWMMQNEWTAYVHPATPEAMRALFAETENDTERWMV